jgi:hypothetical protein
MFCVLCSLSTLPFERPQLVRVYIHKPVSMEDIENCKQDLDTRTTVRLILSQEEQPETRESHKKDLRLPRNVSLCTTMNMPTNPNRYPRRQRQLSSKNLDYTFWEEREEPQEQVFRQQLPSPQSSRNIQSPRWPRLLVRAPSRRVPRRFAVMVPMKHSS